MTALMHRLATAMNSGADPRIRPTPGMEANWLAFWTRPLDHGPAAALDPLPAGPLRRQRRTLAAPSDRAARRRSGGPRLLVMIDPGDDAGIC